MSDDPTIRPIEPRDDPAVEQIIRTVMTEFGASGVGFAIHDPEVPAMTAAYSVERTGFYVIERAGRVVGSGGFAQLAGASPEICELRKMYFLPELRGLGMGRRLLEHALAAARAAGYTTCYLETLRTMTQAQKLYEASGFVRIAKPLGHTGHFGCDAWYTKKL